MDPNTQPSSNYQSAPTASSQLVTPPAPAPVTPRPPVSQNPPSATGSMKAKKSISPRPFIAGVIVVVVLAAGYYIISGIIPSKIASPQDLAKQPGAGETQVTNALETDTKIPDGFPTNIPVEAQNLTQSYKIEYKDHDVTEYTVAFTTTNSKDVIWKTYADLIMAGGYTLATSSSQDMGLLQAKRWDNELNVSVNPYGENFLVTINYIERK